MLRRTTLAVISVLASSVTFAGAMGPTVACSPGAVTVPCEGYGWDIGLTALYLKPVYSANWAYLNYALTATGRSYNNHANKWDWGFKLEGAYHFNTGNDFNVNWYHFQDKTQQPFDGPVSLEIKPQWDALNFEFGQFVDFSTNKKMRFHGGAQLAEIQTNLKQYTAGITVTNVNAKFSGFGPRLGIDMSYFWLEGLAMYAKGATALIYGSNSFTDYDGTYTDKGTKESMVPEAEIRLGANYAFALEQGILTLDLGYLWVNYFDALHSSETANSHINDTNLSLTGPYLGLRYLGNI